MDVPPARTGRHSNDGQFRSAADATTAQKQLNADNARDIDEFMDCWAEDREYFAFPDTLLARGHAAVRARHIERFREPHLHGALLGRIVAAGLVVDRETVTRDFPEGVGEVDVIAIYEVENGKIARAWFKTGPPRFPPPAKSG